MSSFCDEKSEQFWNAASTGDLRLVETLSRDPEVDPHWLHDFGWTPLHATCSLGHVDVVRYLLGFQERPLDFNVGDRNGSSPLIYAIASGSQEIVRMLLVADKNHHDYNRANARRKREPGNHNHDDNHGFADGNDDDDDDDDDSLARISVNSANLLGETPLWWASSRGHVGKVKLLLGCSRGVHLEATKALEIARENGSRKQRYQSEGEEDFRTTIGRFAAIGDLIEEYQRNPREVQFRLWRELGLHGPLAGELFALVVYMSDGYLRLLGDQVLERREKSLKAERFRRIRRFFKIASQLPMDLQMVLCNRVFGLGDLIVKRIHSEEGFRKFALAG